MAAKIVAALGENRMRLVVLHIQRNENRGVGTTPDLDLDGLLWGQEHAPQPVPDRSRARGHRRTIFVAGWML